jgi:type III pantothenate kinase
MSKSNMVRSPTAWIALVIGNTRLHWGCGMGNTLYQSWHTPHLSEAAIATLVAHHFDFSALSPILGAQPLQTLPSPQVPLRGDSDSMGSPLNVRLILASVVPQQTTAWLTHCPHAIVITLDTLPLTNTYPTLGIDRALAAYGSVARSGKAALVMDAGTAFTLTGVDETFRLIGGAILPGVGLQFRSLGTQTANLPLLPTVSDTVELPNRWATDTETAILSGVLHTLVSGVRDFVQDWCDRYPDSVLVLTGGDRQRIAAGLQHSAPTLAQRIQISDTAVMEGLCCLIPEGMHGK